MASTLRLRPRVRRLLLCGIVAVTLASFLWQSRHAIGDGEFFCCPWPPAQGLCCNCNGISCDALVGDCPSPPGLHYVRIDCVPKAHTCCQGIDDPTKFCTDTTDLLCMSTVWHTNVACNDACDIVDHFIKRCTGDPCP